MASKGNKVKNFEQSITISEKEKAAIAEAIKRKLKEEEEDRLVRIKMQENLDKYNAEQALKNQE